MGEKVDGDNSEANFDYNNQGVCGSRSDRRAVWYEINGSGKEVTINLCTNNEQITDFGVFRKCNTQNCLGAPAQQLVIADCEKEETNEYKFIANDGESYYVHVRSDVLFEGVGSDVSLSDSNIYAFRTLAIFTSSIHTKHFCLTELLYISTLLVYNMVYGTY